ncbi:NUP133 [[Candida] subhashii]|uniref:NUP133 n=1 Tax=[Candida] subhashii TaxID=561895 RepID=A0A8J5R6V1_9ASCO|nr:NUP133 [[Candida] subhashii]KAG7665935.1 NUP133 [[Candida] subhashii]
MANIQEFKAIKSWIFDTGLVIRVEEIFSEQFVKKQQQTSTVSQQTKENAHHIVQVLYYFITCAIKYMEKHEPSGKILKDYKHWYNGKETEWIKALLRLGLVNEALVLAEQYRAFGSLVVILESQREELSDTEEINQLYGKYFEMFGYSFASSVYSYYLKTGRIQPLLLDFMNYKHYLLEYFEKNPDKTANVSWIRSLLDQDFITASEALVRSANLKPKDKVLNREIKYSIAKLATIAASQSSEITDEKVSEIERQLEIVRYQKAVYNALAGQIKLESLKLEEFRKSYVNHDLDNSLVNSVVEQYFQSFIEGIQLSPERLIDLLTTLKPSLLKKMGFANALRVAQSFQNESIADFYISVVWLRLLTIGEGEKLFMQWDNKNVSDEINKKKIVDSTLFNTLKEIKLESKLIERLDTLLVNPVVGDEHEDNITINQLNESLSSVLRKYLNNNQRNKNFKLWVEAVKEEVKLSL